MDRGSSGTLFENERAQLGARLGAAGLTRRERRERDREAAGIRRRLKPGSTVSRDGGAVDEPTAPSQDPSGAGSGGVQVLTRRERRRRAERRRRILVVIPTLAVLVFATVVIGQAVRRADTDSTAPSAAAPPSGVGASSLAPATLLFEHRTADGRSDLLLVVGADQAPDGSSVLMVPAATLAEVPSLGRQPLAEVAVLAGPDLLPITIENLVGVGLGTTATLDDAALTAALEPAAPITVTVRSEIQAIRPDGEVIIPAGDQSLSAADAASVLTATGDGGELDDLVTVQSVLGGWLASLADPAAAEATLAVRPELAALVDAATTTTRIATLPVDSLATPSGERFEVRSTDLADYTRAAFPEALLGEDGVRPRVEVLNGTGTVGSAQRVSAIVIPAGGNVTLTNNVPGFGVDETQVVYYRDSDRAAAESLLDAIGCGRLARAGEPIGIVDVTIIIGADCPEF
ncbi:MAG TPA: LCP family protein [Acidimicrobiia bacterium]|nr:LCP family protein [Acidimicrobiia bacterium]